MIIKRHHVVTKGSPLCALWKIGSIFKEGLTALLSFITTETLFCSIINIHSDVYYLESLCKLFVFILVL